MKRHPGKAVDADARARSLPAPDRQALTDPRRSESAGRLGIVLPA
jgi:hypothetical protein